MLNDGSSWVFYTQKNPTYPSTYPGLPVQGKKRLRLLELSSRLVLTATNRPITNCLAPPFLHRTLLREGKKTLRPDGGTFDGPIVILKDEIIPPFFPFLFIYFPFFYVVCVCACVCVYMLSVCAVCMVSSSLVFTTCAAAGAAAMTSYWGRQKS